MKRAPHCYLIRYLATDRFYAGPGLASVARAREAHPFTSLEDAKRTWRRYPTHGEIVAVRWAHKRVRVAMLRRVRVPS